MTRSELIAELAAAYPHLLTRDIERIVHAVFDEIGAALARGDRVELRGFGAFLPANGRPGRGAIPGPAMSCRWRKKRPFFKVGKELRNASTSACLPAKR